MSWLVPVGVLMVALLAQCKSAAPTAAPARAAAEREAAKGGVPDPRPSVRVVELPGSSGPELTFTTDWIEDATQALYDERPDRAMAILDLQRARAPEQYGRAGEDLEMVAHCMLGRVEPAVALARTRGQQMADRCRQRVSPHCSTFDLPLHHLRELDAEACADPLRSAYATEWDPSAARPPDRPPRWCSTASFEPRNDTAICRKAGGTRTWCFNTENGCTTWRSDNQRPGASPPETEPGCQATLQPCELR